MGQEPYRRWRFRHLLEIGVYVALILAFAYGARQPEGFDLHKIEYDFPSLLKFLK